MATVALTIAETRDHILKRINAVGSTLYESMVLELLNNALIFVSAAHDWEYLRKKATVTISDTTGIVTLPADLDRVLVLHQSGEDIFLTELSPIDFEQSKEDEGVTTPTFFCGYGYTQYGVTTVAPTKLIEIYTIPSVGTVYQLWYIKYVDELLAANEDTVPAIPPHIWDLVMRKAVLEALKMTESPPTVIAQEERHFLGTLVQYKRRESYGSSKYKSIKQRPDVMNHYYNRMR